MASDRDRFIGTYSGGRFHPFDPRPGEVRLADISQGLAQTCRYAGQTRRFYSVALHSLHVAAELADRGPRLQFYGLLHDAAEAYLTDLPAPVKAELPAFREAEDAILDAVWAAFDVPPPSDDEWAAVMDADRRLRRYETHELLADSDWAGPPLDRDYDLDVSISEARERFEARAEALLDRM
jgi:hypothetical protein